MSGHRHLMNPTQTSQTKMVPRGADGKSHPIVIAAIPAQFPDSTGLEFRPSNSPARSATPLRRRDFDGNQVLGCLRPDAQSSHFQHHRMSDHAPIAAAGTSPLDVSETTPPPRSNSPTSTARGMRKYEFANAHSKNIVFPTEAPRTAAERQLWSSTALSDGSHMMPQKRRVATPTRDAPDRTGRKLIVVEGHIEGSGVHVTSEEPKQPPQRRPPANPAPDHGLLVMPDESPDGRAHPVSVGLTGFAPTGRKRIDVPGNGNLLEHRNEGWKIELEKRGVQGRGQHNGSFVVWNLASYTPEELHEKPYKPLTTPMGGGAPPFFPDPIPPRKDSPFKRRYIDPGTNHIFGDAPSSYSPNVPVRGRSPGRYSPLRQPPPGQGLHRCG